MFLFLQSFVAIVLSILSALTGLLIFPLSVIFLYDYFTAPEQQRVKNFDYEHQTEEVSLLYMFEYAQESC